MTHHFEIEPRSPELGGRLAASAPPTRAGRGRDRNGRRRPRSNNISPLCDALRLAGNRPGPLVLTPRISSAGAASGRADSKLCHGGGFGVALGEGSGFSMGRQ